jgi:IS30 family transposase
VRTTGKYRYLTFEDRKKIEAWYLIGDRPADIAARLSVHYTTIYKELQRGATGELDANQREGYSAELAERRLRESFKRRGKKSVATLAQ